MQHQVHSRGVRGSVVITALFAALIMSPALAQEEEVEPEPDDEPVLARLEGRVERPDGTPVVHAQVCALPAFDDRPFSETEVFEQQGMVATDSYGRFEVADLIPGSYRVAAVWIRTAEGMEGLVYLTHSEPVLADPERVDAVSLVLHPGTHVTGEVRDREGLPLPAATIQVQSSTLFGNRFEATSDPRGQYRIEWVPPGKYRVAVLKGGEDDYSLEVVQTMVVPRGLDELEVDLGSAPGRRTRVSGWIRRQGKPWSDAKLGYLPAAGGVGSLAGGLSTTQTDDRGFFVLDDARPGPALFVIEVSPRNTLSLRSEVPSGLDAVIDLEVPEGVVRGGVVTADGAVATRGQVQLFPASYPRESILVRSLATHQYQARVDEAGRFAIDPVAPGEYGVVWGGSHVREAGQVLTTISVGDEDILLEDLPLAEASAQLTLSPPEGEKSHQEGTIAVYSEQGLPLAQIPTASTGPTTISLVPGSYRVLLQVWGYAPTLFSVEAVAGQTVNREVVPARGGEIAIEIRNPGGEPVTGAIVVLRDEDDLPFSLYAPPLGRTFMGMNDITDASGRLSLSSIPSGEWQVMARSGGHSVLGAIRVVEGESASLILTLP